MALAPPGGRDDVGQDVEGVVGGACEQLVILGVGTVVIECHLGAAVCKFDIEGAATVS